LPNFSPLAQSFSPMTALPATVPALSCFALTLNQYCDRIDAAEELEDQMQAHYNNKHAYGREILWHPAFAAEYIAMIGRMPLTEVACWHGGLDTWCHDGKPLDLYDYAYIADLLREGLADNPTPLAALRLNRALAWVEQAGTVLLAEQARLAPVASATNAPLMTASAA
jgi:hypothetical protein